jgi:hypothetical protein
MQTIIIDCVPVIDPQLASIIRDDAKPVMACSSDCQGTHPAYRKVITSCEAAPLATSVAIIHHLDSASHVGLAAGQVLTATALPKVENMLHPRATRDSSRLLPAATAFAPATGSAFALGTYNDPSISSVRAMIPEKHPCSTTALKELNSHKTPPTTNVPSGHSTTPTV